MSEVRPLVVVFMDKVAVGADGVTDFMGILLSG